MPKRKEPKEKNVNLRNQPKRCRWCTDDPLYQQYHDQEWGVPVYEDQALFERLALEGMQAGLSWLTVLKKRQAMRERFHNFDIVWLAEFGGTRMESWLQDPALIRHRGKLEALVHNAGLVLELQHAADEGDAFARLLWGFAPEVHVPRQTGDVPTYTEDALRMAKFLKRRMFKFVGPTTCYAFMQSVGMVNGHTRDCFAYALHKHAWENSYRKIPAVD
ncbi:MAG: DNA-3-methyladenine glycosylase I [Pseudomonadota bacterium]